MSAPQSEAAKRAAARKAKILARGNTGLAKLAQTARGEEADALYGDESSKATSAASSRPATPSIPTPHPSASSNTNTSTSRPIPNPGNQGMSAEQQTMSAQLEAMMSMFGGGGGGAGAGGGTEGMPDMSRLMAQLMGDPSAQGQGPGQGQNLLGDIDDPAGLGGFPGNPGDNPFANLGALGGLSGLGGLGGDSPFGGVFGVKTKSKTEKYFPLIHFIAIVILGILSVSWWEPSIHSRTALGALGDVSGIFGWAKRWSGYAGRRGWAGKAVGVIGGVEPVPLFWAFTTVELILQTTRFMILNSPPPPHSLISTFLPLLPPKISRPLITGSRYLSLLSQMWKDGCLLVFTIGFVIIFAEWIGA